MSVNKIHYSTAGLTKAAFIASLRDCHVIPMGLYIFIERYLYMLDKIHKLFGTSKCMFYTILIYLLADWYFCTSHHRKTNCQMSDGYL